jgi:DNA-binding HxlR family transcriptional regulator
MPPNKENSPEETARQEAMVHEMLGHLADKWTLMVLDALALQKELRFSRLMEGVPGISQKMLTRTLRQLERDGLLIRTVFPVVPPRVEYRLTPLGESLGEAVCAIWTWVEAHLDAVEKCRRAYDRAELRRAREEAV